MRFGETMSLFRSDGRLTYKGVSFTREEVERMKKMFDDMYELKNNKTNENTESYGIMEKYTGLIPN